MSTAPSTTWSSCPVCQRPDSIPYVAFTEVAFDACPSCQTVYKRFESSARPDDFYEKGYFHGRKSGRDKRFEHRVRKAQRQLSDVLQFVEARRTLDVGCSLGYVIEAGRRLGLDSAGTDVSEYAVEVCRQKGLRAEVGTLEKLPFPQGSFDMVTLKHVLEHTPTPGAALAELRRVLSPGGAILVAVPNLDYWKGRWQRRTYRYFRPDDLGMQHYVYYTQRSLEQLLRTNGFRVVAASKAHFRRRFARRGPWTWLTEAVRFGILATWQSVARALRLRRELYVVAQLEG
jgi:2-polyprenyl-3-methyl-5-hydroxy-6-metoxy-1,4-benzoquinol methylase